MNLLPFSWGVLSTLHPGGFLETSSMFLSGDWTQQSESTHLINESFGYYQYSGLPFFDPASGVIPGSFSGTTVYFKSYWRRGQFNQRFRGKTVWNSFRTSSRGCFFKFFIRWICLCERNNPFDSHIISLKLVFFQLS